MVFLGSEGSIKNRFLSTTEHDSNIPQRYIILELSPG
jgi:hypothetical protein